ncbi:MAG: Phosphoesterase family protein [Pedosphaera sp.]|nr:Phosphoesterase family protein [Pedosphaera sp.]
MNLRIRIFVVWVAAFCGSPSITAQIANEEKVGRNDAGRIVLPVNQVLTPAGIQVELPGLRPQVIKLSPDGRILVTSGKTSELLLIDPVTGKVLQRVAMPSEKADVESAPVSSHILSPDKDAEVSYTGLIFSPDGSRIFLSNVNGSIKVFAVETNRLVRSLYTIPLPEVNLTGRKNDIPASLALSHDGKRLYVALNLSNHLLELDASSGKPLRSFDVGTAPYDVVLTDHKAYVSNWGGRRPDAQSITGPAGHGTKVRVDPVRYIANEGSVSVIDLKTGMVINEIMVGLHSSAMELTPNKHYLFVANAGSDTISVIDTRKDRVVETISLRWHPNDFFGASPNALAVDSSGKNLYVCNGTQNAVAVVLFRPGKSKLTGLIPTGWFPGAIAHDKKRHTLYVANIKGTGSGKRPAPGGQVAFNTHAYIGTVSLIPIPTKTELATQTAVVQRNYRRAVAAEASLPPRANVAPRPIPERVGEPSVFKHVVYIIKENRTYDQILGDMREGNGDTNLCIFGEKETPNQHKLAREFVLLDNTYCSGILSADGHQWADTAFATDYMEKSFASFPRSYPDGMEERDVDALAYSPAGFIWDNALAHGKTLRDYGEFTMGRTQWKDPERQSEPKFLDVYRDFTNQTDLINISCVPAIESLRPYIMTNTIGWDLTVPDIFRAAQFIKELKQFEAQGKLPELIIICLPNDHTSGTEPGSPTPSAHIADNDLAFGRIVEAISHSSFWKDTCIFSIEDDPQNGWDHVSGYRTTAYVASPYTKRGRVISNNYNQTGLLRTIELILGLPPMNQMDATATPMFDCFTNEPDFTPFNSVPNNIPLDQLNPQPHAIKDPIQRRYARASARLPLDKIDQCPEDLFNRILWNAQKGSHAPYPTWAVTVKDDDD